MIAYKPLLHQHLHHVGWVMVIKAVLVVVMLGIVLCCWMIYGVMVSKEWTVAYCLTC